MLSRTLASGLRLASRSIDWTADKLWSMGGAGYWNSTNPLRKILEGFRAKNGTINQALAADLRTLIAQARHLDRTMPVFRALVEGRKTELVGTGIGVEPDTGDKGLDKALRDLWNDQARHIGAHGESLWSLQRMASGEIDCAGGTVWRGLVLPERLDDDRIPWCVLVHEYEWLAENPVASLADGNLFVAGVETDRIGRARALHLRNPDDVRATGERVPIEDVRHIFEQRWARQAVGAPRLAALIERVFQDDEIVNNEMKAARVAGALAVIIADDELRSAYLAGDLPADFMDVDGGTVSIIGSNSKASAFTHNRPSPNTREWRTTVKGDLAGGAQVSRVWLDRDGQAYNFANSKFDQIRTQMVVRATQDWFGEAVASWPYEQALPWLLMRLGRAMPTDKAGLRRIRRHRLVPDIPPELDEQAAAKAFETANKSGIDSRTDFLGRRGRDPEAIAKQIESEKREDTVRSIALIAEAQQLCEAINAKTPGLNLHWSHVVTLPGAISAPGAYLQAAAPPPEPPPQTQPQDQTMNPADRTAMVDGFRQIADSIRAAQPAGPPQLILAPRMEIPRDIRVDVPPPVVHVAAPTVNVAAPTVHVAAADPAPVQVHNHVRADQPPAQVTVQVAPTPVTIDNQVVVPARRTVVTQGPNGEVIMTPQED